ncbi:MAG: hypothetical protein IPK19_18305 [Chloroflexi bacterium]|nr:hypothetical protein [Chloroflexota bacterium]
MTNFLLEGDANDNNVVNIGDFSLLAAAFATTSGQQAYNPQADFQPGRRGQYQRLLAAGQ